MKKRKITMIYKQLIKINLIVFITYLISLFLENTTNFFHFSKIALGLAIIFISGLNLTVLLNIFLKKKFDAIEFLSISLIGSLFLVPFILTIENEIFKKTYEFLPFVTTITIALATIFAIIFTKKTKLEIFSFFHLTIKKILSSPLSWALVIAIITVSSIFFYKFLPDKDPFSWYIRLTQHLNHNTLSKFSYRPLFYSMSFLFHNLTGISIFIYLKYIIPFISLATFLPIWMVARRATDKRKQLMILLVPFLAPNVILYFLMGMPQAFFLVLLFYFIFFLIYSYLTGDKFYYYFSGIIAFSSTLYHEIGIIIFAFWAITVLTYERKKITANKKEFVLIAIIILSNFSLLQRYLNFFKSWSQKATDFLSHPHFNWMFPLKYTGFGGVEEGSQTLINVAKTYLGYAGPTIILSFILLIYLLLRGKINFKKYWPVIASSREIQILLGLFVFFFAITEILPRFPGIVLFPDRIWVFSAICFSSFIVGFAFLIKKSQISNQIFAIYFFCILLSIGGAFYGNYFKKYQITQGQFHSAEWIKNNLPEDRVILTSFQPQLIQYYSQSAQIGINGKLFHDYNNLRELLNEIKEPSVSIKNEEIIEYSQTIAKLTENQIHKYLNSKSIIEKNNIAINLALKNIEFSKNFLRKPTNQKNETDKHLYIYYTEISEKNPSFKRPGDTSYWGARPDERNLIILDHHPDKFKKIYEENIGNKVIIWKVL
jgi:hypothetical protein